MLNDNNPDAACIYQIPGAYCLVVEKKRTERRSSFLLRSKLKADPSRVTPALCEELYVFYFCTPGRVQCLRSFREFSVRYKCPTTCAGSRQLCLLACVVAL